MRCVAVASLFSVRESLKDRVSLSNLGNFSATSALLLFRCQMGDGFSGPFSVKDKNHLTIISTDYGHGALVNRHHVSSQFDRSKTCLNSSRDIDAFYAVRKKHGATQSNTRAQVAKKGFHFSVMELVTGTDY